MENVATTAKKVRLRVLTPLRVVYDKPVEMVIARTSEGDMGVLYGHDARSALMGDGVLRIFEEDRKKEVLLMILGGIMTVKNNDVSILSEIAESPDKIQEFLAKFETEQAARKVEDESAELYTKRVEAAIRKALINVDLSSYPAIDGLSEQAKAKK